MVLAFCFKDVSEDLVWVTIDRDEVVCFVPQYGTWYESKRTLNQEKPGLDFAKACLVAEGVQLRGEGVQMLLQPGEYHPRVWRGNYLPGFLSGAYDKLEPFEVYGSTFMRSIVASESLFLEVKDLFRVVEPQIENHDCFGQRFRELLILLCTEVEASWAGVLKANDLELAAKGKFNTNHYISVCTPLRLTEWKVTLKDYGSAEFQPFRYWNVMGPTNSLPWYDAYNKVKHDREGNFALGTLGNVLQAAAALHIMQVSQFGPGIFDLLRNNRFSIFDIVEIPVIDFSEVYLSDPVGKGNFHSVAKLNNS